MPHDIEIANVMLYEMAAVGGEWRVTVPLRDVLAAITNAFDAGKIVGTMGSADEVVLLSAMAFPLLVLAEFPTAAAAVEYKLRKS